MPGLEYPNTKWTDQIFDGTAFRLRHPGFDGALRLIPLEDLSHITVTPPVDELQLRRWNTNVSKKEKQLTAGTRIPPLALYVALDSTTLQLYTGVFLGTSYNETTLVAHRNHGSTLVRCKIYWPDVLIGNLWRRIVARNRGEVFP